MSATDTVSMAPPRTAEKKYNYAIGYLKGFIIALVVAHHAVLAYHPSATKPPLSLQTEPRSWQGWPVYDSHHVVWANTFATVNDMFFMALMFFLSGLFVWNSVKRKGGGAYLRDRLARLGLPFIAVAVTVAPLSFYPTYLQMEGHGSFVDYLREWLALGRWSAGPVWFCWVLLVFDILAVSLVIPAFGEGLRRLMGWLSASPLRFFLVLVAVTTVAYGPVVLVVPWYAWPTWGPFTFQASRIFLYLVYFLAGIGMGAWGIERGFFAPDGKLAKRWVLWAIVAAAAFLAHAEALSAGYRIVLPQAWQDAIHQSPLVSGPNYAAIVLFPVFCAAMNFAIIGFFVRFLNTRLRVFDSLSKNAYGIFLIHFAFVSAFGYALSGIEQPAHIKFAVVTAAALAVSWIGTILLRRIPGVAKIV